MKTALTIAGSDSSGGAGIQADIKTMTANGVFATCAVTALTAQNTTGVTDILESTPHFLAEQLDAVFTDIVPDAVKIGMVSSAELIAVIAEKLQQYGAERVVVDPVMVATSGAKLLRDDAIQALTSQLLPLATVLTPNIPEAEILSGLPITDAAGMEAAQVAAALSGAKPEAGRQEVIEAPGGFTVINDAYNANPDSMRASLSTFAALDVAGTRIAVLGDMGELGSFAPQLHEEVGAFAAECGLDRLVCVGQLAQGIAAGAQKAGMPADRIAMVADGAAALADVREHVASGSAVLVKASHFMTLEKVVEGLVE